MNASVLATLNLVVLLLVLAFLTQAIARARWNGTGIGGVIFLFVLAGQVWLIPQAINFLALHSTRLLYPLWFGNWIVTAAAAVTLPLIFHHQNRELLDAARLDGAGTLTIFRHVIWPTARTAVLALAFLVVMTTWSEFAQPLLAGTALTAVDFTVPTAPRDLAILIGVSIFATLPAIFLYLFARKQFATP